MTAAIGVNSVTSPISNPKRIKVHLRARPNSARPSGGPQIE